MKFECILTVTFCLSLLLFNNLFGQINNTSSPINTQIDVTEEAEKVRKKISVFKKYNKLRKALKAERLALKERNATLPKIKDAVATMPKMEKPSVEIVKEKFENYKAERMAMKVKRMALKGKKAKLPIGDLKPKINASLPKVSVPKIEKPSVDVAKQKFDSYAEKRKAMKAKRLAMKNNVENSANTINNTTNIISNNTTTEQTVNRVTSKKIIANNGDVFLVQEMIINAPIKEVWKINTTAEGWMKWVCPIAEFKLGIGETIKTQYDANGVIGDENTNYITIENYVPFENITLKSVLANTWPAFMQKDKERFYNVINFIKINENTTKLISYGIGYRNTQEYFGIIDYIDFMNVQSYEKMIKVLEQPMN